MINDAALAKELMKRLNELGAVLDMDDTAEQFVLGNYALVINDMPHKGSPRKFFAPIKNGAYRWSDLQNDLGLF